MIKCTIFGEFFENWEDTLVYHFTSSYLFFYNSKWFEKNNINIMIICICGKKKKFLEHFWAFRFQHSHFNICTKYYLIKHLSSMLMVAFPQKLCDFVDLFFIRKIHKSSLISMVVIIKIIPHKWGIILVARASQENKRYAQIPPFL